MGFREVSVVGVREILRLWLLGYGQRTVARLAQVDRKTVSRYVAAAEAAGLKHGDPEDSLTDELIGEVVETVRPGRPPGDHGSSWEQLLEHKGFIEERVKKKLTLVKVHDQLCRHTKRTIPLELVLADEVTRREAKPSVLQEECDDVTVSMAASARVGFGHGVVPCW